ncbi:translocator protein 2-like [Dermacentor variabilis]|uniref:translocator protein 2-like n=1 Tax=Dermacentor variabilis TaxID=34621 RepID=UPI003F5B9EFF
MEYKDATQAACWVLLPNLGGLAGLYIIKTRHDDVIKRCVLVRNYPGSSGQLVLWVTFNSAMGYAAYLVFKDGGGLRGPARPALAVFAAGLCYNWAWPAVFYSKQKFALAMVDMNLLCGSVALLAHMYLPINDRAAKIMLPCIAWTLAMATFNCRVWRWSRRRASD